MVVKADTLNLSSDKNRSLVFFILFFVSGLCALIYEIIWQRMLVLVFGSTVYATTTILVSFMGGLSLGSYLAGKYSAKFKSPIFIYGVIELLIGLFALIFPFLVNQSTMLYVVLYKNVHSNRYFFIIVRFLMLLIILLIPTSLMGATLPTISKGIVSSQNKKGYYTGLLYAFNTIGSVIGVLFATFYSIEKFGLRNTTYIAATLNIVIFFVIFIFPKYRNFKLEDSFNLQIKGKTNELSYENREILIVIIYAISGFSALSLEVLWTRELVFLLGMDSYAFGTMLSAFLFGIAIGSFVISKLIEKIKNLYLMFGLLEIGIALTTLLNFIFIPGLYDLKQGIYLESNYNLFTFVLSGYVLTLILMMLPTLMMGAIFPIVIQIYKAKNGQISTTIGNVYSINTLGSILGALVTGFIMVPLFGVINSFKIIISVNIILGSILIYIFVIPKIRNRYIGYIYILFSIMVTTVFFVFIPISKEIVKYSYIMKNKKNKLLYYSEDAYAAVSVVDVVNTGRRLYVDSGLAADTSRFDMPSHKLIVHIPLLIQNNPKTALVIGFGMGETSYSITTYSVQVDAVEISKGEIKANKYFYDVNHHVLDNPLLKLTIDDGRNYLLTHDKKYDLISVGIIHPGISANSAGFYGKDFYEQCLSRLTNNGIISQWVPTHGLSLNAFKIIIKTFIDIFPYSTMWFKYTDNFVILLGSKRPLKIDYNTYIEKFKNQKIFNDLKTVDMADPLVLLDSLWMGKNELRRFSKDAKITSDNFPILEFLAAKSFNKNGLEILQAISDDHMDVMNYITNIDLNKKDEVINTLKIIRKATDHIVKGHIYKKKEMFEKSAYEFKVARYISPGYKCIIFI